MQRRSRERIEQILLAAAEQLAKAGSSDELTTTSVSKRSGVPVATIYRYFTDRMAIIAELIDRETAEIDTRLRAELDALDTITLADLLHAMMYAHLRHFQKSRRSVMLWFGTRSSAKVIKRIDSRYDYMGRWVYSGSVKAGLARAEAPKWGGAMIVWQCDRIFEFIFREDRSLDEQEAIMREFLDMLLSQIQKYATPAGLEGIPRDRYLELAGRFDPPYSDGEESDEPAVSSAGL